MQDEVDADLKRELAKSRGARDADKKRYEQRVAVAQAASDAIAKLLQGEIDALFAKDKKEQAADDAKNKAREDALDKLRARLAALKTSLKGLAVDIPAIKVGALDVDGAGAVTGTFSGQALARGMGGGRTDVILEKSLKEQRAQSDLLEAVVAGVSRLAVGAVYAAGG